MNKAYFILSTGRCGTQWIANYLSKIGGSFFNVEHEPLHNDYAPRKMINYPTGNDVPQQVIHHLENIKKVLKTKNYIECGHPLWSTIPFFHDELKEQMAIIHVVRHPIPTAFSWLTHQAYCPPIVPYLPEKILLSPDDKGVIFPEYKSLWTNMTPYEKSLYYWLEINTFAVQLEEKGNIPWLRLEFEELFSDSGLAKLHEFLHIPDSPDLQENLIIDKYHYISDRWYDWQLIHKHIEVIKLAEKLGYDCCNIDDNGIKKRYLMNQTS